mgnify:FL=1|jgi:hypothetical protein|tara:strand:- start:924 stop:1379 length:456 start_codon:yes stop_codon:yes gene_type:complete
MTDSAAGAASAPIQHNIRIVTLASGENVICNFSQVREDDKFVAYQMLYPLITELEVEGVEGTPEATYRVNYRRWNVFTPYEDFRLNPQHVVTAMPPNNEIMTNYVQKLKEAGVDLSFLPNNGEDILNGGAGTTGESSTAAATEGPVASSTS